MSSGKAQRFFALMGALLFLLTTAGFSVLVVLQIRNQNKQDAASNTAQTQPKEGKLEGTKLANFTPVAQVTQVQKVDIKEGTGPEVKPSDTITFHYTGALAKDGTIFQSSHDTGEAATFPLSQLIKGWQMGIPGMKAGGVRRLLIPAAEGYGDQSQPGIPANSDLVFDIELIKIGQ